MSKQVKYEIEVENEEEVKNAIYSALVAGINAMNEKKLPSFAVGFHLMGKWVSILVTESKEVN